MRNKRAMNEFFKKTAVRVAACFRGRGVSGESECFDPCDDTSWGILSKLSEKANEIGVRIASRRLVVVLESPHKEEYEPNGEPRGPARGRTGEHLKEHLADVVKEHVGEINDCEVLLMNAIQYQCSLGNLGTSGQNKRSYRKRCDTVFREVWNCEDEKGRKNFEKRLQDLGLDEKDVILNTCTKGATKNHACGSKSDWLRCLVATAICNSFKDANSRPTLLRANHPASWTKQPAIEQLFPEA